MFSSVVLIMITPRASYQCLGVGEDYEISNLKRSHDDSDTEDPKKLCIDEEPIDLNCKKCNYIAKWPSDLDRHMKVCVSCLTASIHECLC